MAFAFRLVLEDGTPADPPVLHTAVPTWQAGDTIPLGRDGTLHVIEVRPVSGPLDDPVLVVRPEDVVVQTILRSEDSSRVHS